MLLADGYPSTRTVITAEQAARISELGVRLYVEYPEVNEALGIVGYGDTERMGYDRAICTNPDRMGMAAYSLLYVHGAIYAKKAADADKLTSDIESGADSSVWLVNATVAGYDTADFGLTDCTPYTMLEACPKGNVLIASTKLSQFISARYAPQRRWQSLWTAVLSWVSKSEVAPPVWTAAVNPRYAPDERLDGEAYREAVRLNMEWYKQNMLKDDGTPGIYQCYNSGCSFDEYGEQSLNSGIRADCTGESIGAIALAGVLLDSAEYKELAYTNLKWMLTQAAMANADRANPTSSQYGLLSWYDDERYLGHYYGDDNAKAILGLMLGSSVLGTNEFDRRILEAITGNFRTTGRLGFRGSMLRGADIEKHGWRHFFDREYTNYWSHFESLLWGCYLWAYDRTGYEPFLTRTKTAISMMMKAYSNTLSAEKDESLGEWRWTNGMQQERAKMLLSLAWLARLEPTEEHIGWLDRMINDMMAYQDARTGALRDAVGEAGQGHGEYGPFVKNSDYGKHESPVIQNNGDPCTDSLYTSSFAMMTLNEAYKAMAAIGRYELAETYRGYAKSLSDYHVRIQQVSENRHYNGVWFRGFDYEKWETYGSDGDAGWGIWCTETGWCQAWICATLSLQELDTCIWDITEAMNVGEHFEATEKLMLKSDS